MLSRSKLDLGVLLKPYYFVNLIMSLSFIVLRHLPVACNMLFSTCELSWRETEILMFVAIVIAFRSKRSGTTSLAGYLGSLFVYLKGANVILFLHSDFRMALIFIVLWIVQFLTLPEPVYKGPENVIYFDGTSITEELTSNSDTIWIIAFYGVWSRKCRELAPIFSKISANYYLPNLKFGKLDVTRYGTVAEKFGVSSSVVGPHLPTIILFKQGKECIRVPTYGRNGKVFKFIFSEENIVAVFNLNNVYLECKKLLPSTSNESKKSN